VVRSAVLPIVWHTMVYSIYVTNHTDMTLFVGLQGNLYHIDWKNALKPGQSYRLDHHSPWRFRLVVEMNPAEDEKVTDGTNTATTLKLAGGVALAAVTAGYAAFAAIPAGAWSAGAITIAGSPWVGVGTAAAGFATEAVVTSVSAAGAASFFDNKDLSVRMVSLDESTYHIHGGQVTVEGKTLTNVSPMRYENTPGRP